MRRLAGICFGLGVHAVFAVIVYQLFFFLYGRIDPGPGGGWLWLDALLALQFSVVHSLLLYPSVRSWLTRRLIAGPFYGCFFCAATCAGLELMFLTWQPSTAIVWSLDGPARLVMDAMFGLSWAALFYSLYLTGLGYQTGWTPWWHWFRGQPQPKRTFAPRGAYRILRHPVYLSFLGLIWFTPNMTADHAILTVLWTAYIFVGSWLKDRRLAHFLGAEYRSYASRVPGYPGLPGSLGRWLPEGAPAWNWPSRQADRGPA
jgi:protein-S-isoprenylcysteine O-methyltransferase Ste14